MTYYQAVEHLATRIGNSYGIGVAWKGIGNVHFSLKAQDSALKAYERALRIQEERGDEFEIAALSQNISNVYAEKGDLQASEKYLRKALSLYEKIQYMEGLAQTCLNLAETLWGMGRHKEALPYARRGVELAREMNTLELLARGYRVLAPIEAALARRQTPHPLWEAVYQHLYKALSYTDPVYGSETIREIERIQARYEYEKREALLKAEEEKNRAILELRLTAQKTRLRWLGVALLIALGAITGLARLLHIIRRQKQQLQTTNTALEESNAALRLTIDELSASYQTIASQHKQLAQKNREISESIEYARRIQEALMPPQALLETLLPQSALLYWPRDIVAGDFYWVAEAGEYVYLAVADATGHGVPGAFVSLLCLNALQAALLEEGNVTPDLLLNRVKSLVSEQLTRHHHLRDGMDIALIRLSRHYPTRLDYAGANRPLWIQTSSNELIELAATRQPIGFTETTLPYQAHHIDLTGRTPAYLYLFSDGLTDQLGGPKGRKLSVKNLRELLSGLHAPEPATRLQAIERYFLEWKGNYPQLDDVTCLVARIDEPARA